MVKVTDMSNRRTLMYKISFLLSRPVAIEL